MGTGIRVADINQIKQYAEDKEYDKALVLIRQQDLSKTFNSQFARICGEVLLYTKNYEESRYALINAHKMAPEGNRINYDLIMLYLETGEPVLAEKYYEQYVFNAGEKDYDLCWLNYHMARSKHSPAEALYDALAPIHTPDRSDELAFEFMKIYRLMGDQTRFDAEYQYWKDTFRESVYKEQIERLAEKENIEEDLYTYPNVSVLKHDAQIDALEESLLEQDYYRMYPKEPEIVLMADDYNAQDDQSYMFKAKMDKWSQKRREKAEKRAAVKAERKQAKQDKKDAGKEGENAEQTETTEKKPKARKKQAEKKPEDRIKQTETAEKKPEDRTKQTETAEAKPEDKTERTEATEAKPEDRTKQTETAEAKPEDKTEQTEAAEAKPEEKTEAAEAKPEHRAEQTKEETKLTDSGTETVTQYSGNMTEDFSGEDASLDYDDGEASSGHGYEYEVTEPSTAYDDSEAGVLSSYGDEDASDIGDALEYGSGDTEDISDALEYSDEDAGAVDDDSLYGPEEVRTYSYGPPKEAFEYEYEIADEPETSEYAYDTVDESETSEYAYDTVDEAETSEYAYDTADEAETSEYAYDTADEAETSEYAYDTVDEPETSEYAYDTVDEVETSEYAYDTVDEPETSEYAYDTVDESETSEYAYDTADESETSEYAYDTADEPETSEYAYDTVDEAETSEYAYDTADESETSEYAYDIAEEPEVYEEPGEISEYSYEVSEEQAAYDAPEEPSEYGGVEYTRSDGMKKPDKHQQAFDEYDALLKQEEERLAQQFEREERLLREAENLLASVQTGVNDWNSQKVNNLFEAFDTDIKKKNTEPKVSEKPLSTLVNEIKTKEPDEKTLFENSFESVNEQTFIVQEEVKEEIPKTDDTTERVHRKQPKEELAKEKKQPDAKEPRKTEMDFLPQTQLREHMKNKLMLDAYKKEILQQLKERR